MLVILSEEAQGDGGDWIVTPGAVETAEKVAAFLGKQSREEKKSLAAQFYLVLHFLSAPLPNGFSWKKQLAKQSTFAKLCTKRHRVLCRFTL